MLITQLFKTHQILKYQSEIKNAKTHFLISADFIVLLANFTLT